MIFINFSNLHTNKWPADRLAGVRDIIGDEGEIVNLAFPLLSPSVSKEDVYEQAEISIEKIMSHNPDIVFCQGEFSLCFRIVELLKEKGIKTVTVCNERIISEENGRSISGFRFVQFREF